jgi:hypothetical protein
MVAILLATTAWIVTPAAASPLPTLLANSKCANGCKQLRGVYKVRPHRVVLAEAFGGDLTLSWSSWTRAAASGSGTSVVSGMGSTTTLAVTVRAADVKHGKFTRLTLTATTSSGQQSVERLHLATSGGTPGWTT